MLPKTWQVMKLTKLSLSGWLFKGHWPSSVCLSPPPAADPAAACADPAHLCPPTSLLNVPSKRSICWRPSLFSEGQPTLLGRTDSLYEHQLQQLPQDGTPPSCRELPGSCRRHEAMQPVSKTEFSLFLGLRKHSAKTVTARKIAQNAVGAHSNIYYVNGYIS